MHEAEKGIMNPAHPALHSSSTVSLSRDSLECKSAQGRHGASLQVCFSGLWLSHRGLIASGPSWPSLHPATWPGPFPRQNNPQHAISNNLNTVNRGHLPFKGCILGLVKGSDRMGYSGRLEPFFIFLEKQTQHGRQTENAMPRTQTCV